jgi:hypothetical protein
VARTARLSRRFYDTFGDENTNELVGLLNDMDATYLAELRVLNETNFARFDAKLEQRVAELRGEMTAGFARADAKLEQSLAELRGEMTTGFERFGKELAAATTAQVRWLVVLLLPVWMGLLVVLLAVLNRA